MAEALARADDIVDDLCAMFAGLNGLHLTFQDETEVRRAIAGAPHDVSRVVSEEAEAWDELFELLARGVLERGSSQKALDSADRRFHRPAFCHVPPGVIQIIAATCLRSVVCPRTLTTDAEADMEDQDDH